MEAKDRLIVALDVDGYTEAQDVVNELRGVVGLYKVGWQLFFRHGWDAVYDLQDAGMEVFLDLKIEDIGSTVHKAIANMADELGGVKFLSIKGGKSVVVGAYEALWMGANPRLLMLTSLSNTQSMQRRVNVSGGTWDQALLDAGCSGFIASGSSVGMVRQTLGVAPIIVAPGIRFGKLPHHDHRRVLSPYQAIKDGADYIVVGRPIMDATDKRSAAEAIIEEIAKARGA